MGTVDETTAYFYRITEHDVRLQILDRGSSTDDVDNRVHGADFVEMHVFWLDVMDFAFDPCDTREHFQCSVCDASW